MTELNDEAPLALRIQDLQFSYGADPLLNIPALDVAPGEKVAVIGPSGCGKSTLMHLISGLIRPNSGRILLGSQEISGLGESELDRLRGREIGIVFQHLHLIPAISVLENLLLAQRLARAEINKDAAMELLQRLDIAEKAHDIPGELSQGQAQRAAIARAVAHKPKLVIGDEPTSALDEKNASEAISLLSELSSSGGFALLVVTHDDRVRGAMDRVLDLGEAS